MRNLGRILLLVAALLLAFVIGVLVGRRQGAAPASQEGAAGVQITTEDQPAAPAAPLPAPVQAPVAAPVTRPPVDLQVQEDAAAVGMTTRDDAPEPAAPDAAPKTGASASGADQPAPEVTGAAH